MLWARSYICGAIPSTVTARLSDNWSWEAPASRFAGGPAFGDDFASDRTADSHERDRQGLRRIDSQDLRRVPGPADLPALRDGPGEPGGVAIAGSRARDRGGHGRGDARPCGRLAGERLHRRHGSQPGDAGLGSAGRHPPSGGMAPGGRDEPAVRGCLLRCRRVPVRRDVLPGQGQGVRRGTASAAARRRASSSTCGTASRRTNLPTS